MSTKHFHKTIFAASFAAALACSGAAFADTDADDAGVKPHSATVGTAISDTAITAKVKGKFANDSRLNNTDITVSTANGVVYLKGAAPSMSAKHAASQLAKNVDGVTRVDNDITTPAGAEVSSMEAKSKSAGDKTERVASDSWITTKVKTALLADSVTKGFEISVKTTHKVVHLTGTVDSQAAVDRAKDVARGIKHVKSVDTSGLKTGNG